MQKGYSGTRIDMLLFVQQVVAERHERCNQCVASNEGVYHRQSCTLANMTLYRSRVMEAGSANLEDNNAALSGHCFGRGAHYQIPTLVDTEVRMDIEQGHEQLPQLVPYLVNRAFRPLPHRKNDQEHISHLSELQDRCQIPIGTQEGDPLFELGEGRAEHPDSTGRFAAGSAAFEHTLLNHVCVSGRRQ